MTKNPDFPDYDYKSTVTLTALPWVGYHFVGWSGDAIGSANPLTVVMDTDKTITATFAVNTYPLDVTVVGHGTVVKTPDRADYVHGTAVELAAFPDSGYRFQGWGGDTVSAATPLTVSMRGRTALVATFLPQGGFTWSGAGDGTSWSDPANWEAGFVPGATNEVVLDHSRLKSSFDVVLPAGTTTVAIARLRIRPDSGRIITLTLPSGNTANPGLRVGDGVPETDDLVLHEGAVVRNASGAVAGPGIEVVSAVNGTVRLLGGRYVHASLRTPAGVAAALSDGPGTESGEFEYDVPSSASFLIANPAHGYGRLTLRWGGGSGTYGVAGGGLLTIRGTLAIWSGASFAPTTLSALSLAGDLVNDGGPLVLGQTVGFTGSSVQRVSGTSAIELSSTSVVVPGATLAVSTSVTQHGTMNVLGTLRIDDGGTMGGSGSYLYGANGALVFNHSSGIREVVDGSFWPANGGPATVVVQGGGGISMGVARTVGGSFRTGGMVGSAFRLTLSGELTLDEGGMLDSPPIYRGQATLVYNAGRAVGNEWTEGSAVGPGIPHHVTVRAATGTVRLPNTDRTVPGNLTVESGTIALHPDFGHISVFGNLGVSTPTGVQNGVVIFAGAGHQTLSGPEQLQIDYLRLTKTDGTVRLLSHLTCNASQGGDALSFGGTMDVLDLNGHTLILAGSIGGPNPDGAFRGGGSSSLVLNGAGPASTVRFVPGSERLQTLTVNRSGTPGGVTLEGAVRVGGTLFLTNGGVRTGRDTLTIEPGAAVVRSSGHVEGNLQKWVGPGSTSVTFEVGTGVRYAPVEIRFGQVTESGFLTARTVGLDHPSVGSSGLDSVRTAHRFWSVENKGVVFDRYDVRFQFTSADLEPTADPSWFAVRRHDATGWTAPTTGARTATSTEALGLASFGDFVVGEPRRYTLEVDVIDSQRYALEVSFPSVGGVRRVVDATVNPLLGEIDPRLVEGKTFTIHRDGRVTVGGYGLGGGLSRPAPPGSTEGRDGRAATAGLTTSFVPRRVGFTPYTSGTLIPAWGDFDNDGDPDLPLFRNDGGTFTEIPGFRALLQDGDYHGSAWSDYDKDGDLDLVLLSYYVDGVSQPTRTRLLRNEGNGVFVDVAPSQGLDFQSRGETAIWADFDGNGWPDLFAPYYSHVAPFDTYIFLYFNDGNGNLVDGADSAGVALSGVAIEGVDVADWDNDGDLDLYFSSRLFLNDGTGRFTDVSAQVGLPNRYDEGGAFVDYDNDGDFDLYVRNSDAARLFRNEGGQLSDVTTATGIPPASLFWGDSWADVDNDGDQDLIYHTRSPFGTGYRMEPARLIINLGDGTFVEDPSFTLLDIREGMAAWADYDGDGDLDLVEGAPPDTLYENLLDAQPGFEHSYLRVRVLDAEGLETETGATVRLRSVSGPVGVIQTRTVGGGGTYLSHNEYTTHLGLGVAGSVARDPDLPGYLAGTRVQLTATPRAGYHFVRWVGDTTSLANPITVVIDGSKSVAAEFAFDTYTLSATAVGNGIVVRAPDQPAYPHGSLVQLTAVPAAGHRFLQWFGDATGSMNPLAVRMDGNKTLFASFEVKSYALDVSVVGNGTVAKNPEQGSYPHGSAVRLTATPAVGHRFVGWEGDTSTTANPLDVVMDDDKNFTATFEIETFVLEVTVVGSGTVVKNPDQASYTRGTTVQLGAIPDVGHHFVGWSGDTSGTVNPVSLVMTGDRSVMATFEPGVLVQWVGATGGGDGVSWSDPGNWNGGTIPGASDTVLLDHSTVTGAYTVHLPPGATTVTISRLVLDPGDGEPITAILPATNTANPGLWVGDGVVGTSDIILNPGAVLRNASGAANGSGIEFVSAGDSIRLVNGGRYVHATLRSAAALAARLSGGSETDQGEFEYDVPDQSNYAIPSSGITYGSLTLTRTAGSATYSSSGSGPLAIRGHFRIRSGVTFSSSMSGDLHLRGNLVNQGATLTLPSSQAVFFGGGRLHTVSGSNPITIAGPGTIRAGDTLAISGVSFRASATLAIEGALRIDEGGILDGGTFTYHPSTGWLIFNTSSQFTVNSNRLWPASGGPAHVAIEPGGGIKMSFTRTVPGTLQTAAPVANADRLTLNGTHRVLAGASLGGRPAYGDDATLVYATGFSVGDEWSSGATVGPGTPRNVLLLAGSGTVSLPSQDRTVPGDLSVLSGNLELHPSGVLRVQGHVTVVGTILTNGGVLELGGPGTQILSGAGLTLGRLRLAKPAGAVRLAADLTVGSELLFDGSQDFLELDRRTLTLQGTVGGGNPAGVLQGGVGSGVTLSGKGPAGTLRFGAGRAVLDRLKVDRGEPLGGVSLGGPLRVEGVLTLARGNLLTAADTLTLGAAATVARDSGCVEGNLRKTVGVGTRAMSFEVGSRGTYAPVEVTLDHVWAGGLLTASTTGGDHPSLSASALDPARSVNRFWTLRNQGIGLDQYDATFHFAPGDLDEGADPALLAAGRFASPDWHVAVTGNRTPTSTEILGQLASGDFALGEIKTYTLDLTVVGDGRVTKSLEQVRYKHGTVVLLTAVPGAGYHFSGYTGDVTGSGDTLRVVMDGPKSVTATFEVDSYALEVTVVGSGAVTRSPDQVSYAHGTVVSLSAISGMGFQFVGWSGDVAGSADTLTVVMDGPKSVTATFEISTYTLAVAVMGIGSVTQNPEPRRLDHGTAVRLPAAPDVGHPSESWNADGVVGRGAVRRDPGTSGYEAGAVVLLTATPGPGYSFSGWNGDTTSASDTLRMVMNESKSLIATFADEVALRLVVLSPNGGETLLIGSSVDLEWSARDAAGVAAVDIELSREGLSGSFEPIRTGAPLGGIFTWTVSGPITERALLRVVARDSSGNSGTDLSDTLFAIIQGPLEAPVELLRDFALLGPTPNPASGPASIEFSVAREAQIRLSVLDVQGREIAVLAQGRYGPGLYRARWNPRGGDRQEAPGAYFVRYTAAGRIWVRRLVVLW